MNLNRPKSMLAANIAWADEIRERSPALLDTLARGQQPRVLWIGCADSRVPAETITGSALGELFVHRNLANLFDPDDDNGASVLEYAVRVLDVDHVIVCGHYGCGGVQAALLPPSPELPHLDCRIAPLRALAHRHRDVLASQHVTAANRLAELNVLEQVRLLRASPIVRHHTRPPLVHGWIFSLADGRLHILACGYRGSAADTPADPPTDTSSNDPREPAATAPART